MQEAPKLALQPGLHGPAPTYQSATALWHISAELQTSTYDHITTLHTTYYVDIISLTLCHCTLLFH